jgi:hypothetical protein
MSGASHATEPIPPAVPAHALLVGIVELMDDGSFVVFDRSDVFVGRFQTLKQAAAALVGARP